MTFFVKLFAAIYLDIKGFSIKKKTDDLKPPRYQVKLPDKIRINGSAYIYTVFNGVV